MPSTEPSMDISPINLRSLEVRFRNEVGAREGWEQLIAWLVSLRQPGAHRIEARGRDGDGGIDVMVGDLTGDVISVWQAKYFVRIDQNQQREIASSFRRAMETATERRNRLSRWTLCVPVDLDLRARTWWEGFRNENEQRFKVHIELWHAPVLLGMIAEDRAKDLRDYYFGSVPEPQPSAAIAVAPDPEATVDHWYPGATIRLGSDTYLIHEGVKRRVANDRCTIWQAGTADLAGGGRCHLRQVWLERPSSAGREKLAGLRAQAAALPRLSTAPKLLTTYSGEHHFVVVTAQPAGATWRECFPTGPLDRITAARVCGAAVSLCQLLEPLHEAGFSHRELTGEGVILTGQSRKPALRQPGLIGMAQQWDEGSFGMDNGAGASTDVYLLAAMLYQTLTGYPPSGGTSPPIAATTPDTPEDLDQLVRQCLTRDPGRRPGLGSLREALSRAARAFSYGSQR